MNLKATTLKSVALIALFSLISACAEDKKPSSNTEQKPVEEIANPDGISDGMEQEQIEEVNEEAPETTQDIKRGIYVYDANSATFTDCSTGNSYPVAPEERAAELKNTYQAIQNTTQQKMLIEVKGEYDMRSPEEGDDVEMLIAREILGVINKDSCQ